MRSLARWPGRAGYWSRCWQTPTHCTTNWHIDANGLLISDDPNWTPNPNGEWPLIDDISPLPLPHTHVALDDALEQGAMFCNLLRENRSR